MISGSRRSLGGTREGRGKDLQRSWYVPELAETWPKVDALLRILVLVGVTRTQILRLLMDPWQDSLMLGNEGGWDEDNKALGQLVEATGTGWWRCDWPKTDGDAKGKTLGA